MANTIESAVIEMRLEIVHKIDEALVIFLGAKDVEEAKQFILDLKAHGFAVEIHQVPANLSLDMIGTDEPGIFKYTAVQDVRFRIRPFNADES